MSEKTTISPAYVAYSTFKNTIRRLARDGQLPGQIDHSILGTMSGAARSQFFNALRFFGLVDESGVPSKELKQLAVAGEPEWKVAFKPVVLARYDSNIIESLKSGTPNSLREAFGDIGPSLVKPAIRFLVKAACDVEIPVGSHIAKAKTNGNGAPPRRSLRKPGSRPRRDPQPSPEPIATDFKSALLAKFPAFDPNWGEDQQKAWFAAYEKLLSITGEKRSEDRGA